MAAVVMQNDAMAGCRVSFGDYWAFGDAARALVKLTHMGVSTEQAQIV